MQVLSSTIWTEHLSTELSAVLNLFFLPNKLVSPSTVWTTKFSKHSLFLQMMMIMMMMNWFSETVDWGKAIISNQDFYQKFSLSQISDTPRAGVEPLLNQSSEFVE